MNEPGRALVFGRSRGIIKNKQGRISTGNTEGRMTRETNRLAAGRGGGASGVRSFAAGARRGADRNGVFRIECGNRACLPDCETEYAADISAVSRLLRHRARRRCRRGRGDGTGRRARAGGPCRALQFVRETCRRADRRRSGGRSARGGVHSHCRDVPAGGPQGANRARRGGSGRRAGAARNLCRRTGEARRSAYGDRNRLRGKATRPCARARRGSGVFAGRPGAGGEGESRDRRRGRMRSSK